MGTSVTTDVAALRTSHALWRTDQSVTVALRRLSSGVRISAAADDAAGLTVAEGLRARSRGMAQAVRNGQDGIGLVRTADGALDGMHALLQRMRDLAVQAGNAGVMDARAVSAVRGEFEQLKAEIDRVTDTTSVNGIPLLDGTYDRDFQVGADVADTITVAIRLTGRGVDVAGLGLARVDLTAGLGVPHTRQPAVAADPATPAPGRLTLAGDFVSAGAYAAAYGGLTGTVDVGGRTFDLSSVDHTGAVTAQDHLDRLNAAAAVALGTGPTPFAATATGLVLTGETPGPASTAADASALTPRHTGGSSVASTVEPAVPALRNTPAPGRLVLAGDHVSAGAYVTSYDALVGSVHAGGRSLDLASVDYTGAVTAQERLDRLNAAAVAALGTGHTPFVATATGLVFTGETPGPTSTPADAAAVSPSYTGVAGTAGTLMALDRAIARVSSLRADLGAVENRFAHRVAGLGVAIGNAMAAESRIRDTDVAAEVTALTRGQVLARAGTAVLAQANQSASRVLELLR